MAQFTSDASAPTQRGAKKSKNQNQLARDIDAVLQGACGQRSADHPKILRELNQRRGTARYCSLCFSESWQMRFSKIARTCWR
jgi:hypothetical protein